MFKDTPAFSGFSVEDTATAKKFYSEVLGLTVKEDSRGLHVMLGGGAEILVYPKGHDHKPATFTVLNFMVENIEKAVDELTAKGVVFEHYDFITMDGRGITPASEQGPRIAWFTDPSGNIMSVIEIEKKA